jgi:hypothetical protein
MKHLAIVLALSLVCLLPAQGQPADPGVEIIMGRLRWEIDHSQWVQVIAAINYTDRVLKNLKVECKFFKNGRLTSTDWSFAHEHNIEPGQMVGVYVRTLGSPDKADCHWVDE